MAIANKVSVRLSKALLLHLAIMQSIEMQILPEGTSNSPQDLDRTTMAEESGTAVCKDSKADSAHKLHRDFEAIPPADIYSTFVANHPWKMWLIGLATIFLVPAIGAIITFSAKDFSIAGATAGFENRGTAEAGELSVDMLLPKSECYGDISLKAEGLSMYYNGNALSADELGDDPSDTLYTECYDGYVDPSTMRRRRLFEGGKRSSKSSGMHVNSFLKQRKQERQLLYGDVGRNYDPSLVSAASTEAVMNGNIEGIVFTLEGEDLMTVAALQSINALEHVVTSALPDWSNYCLRETLSWTVTGEISNVCRPSRSLPNYVAALANTTIAALSENDVSTVKALLNQCHPLYISGSLVGNCWDFDAHSYTTKYKTAQEDPACSLTSTDQVCATYNAAYDLFNSVLPKVYILEEAELKHSQTMLINHIDSSEKLDVWNLIEPLVGTVDGTVAIQVIYQSGTKDEVFNSMMGASMTDFVWLFVMVFCLILTHTGSIWITVCGSFQIIMAFAWGFTFYNVVLWRSFFPFLNMIALFLVMGIGADDLFVYMDAWKQSFTVLPPTCPLANRLTWVMKRAGGAMLITTLTTSVSFIANIASPVTALKAFGLFTASVVMADFLLMLLFVPATVTLYYLHFSPESGQVQLSIKENPCFQDGCYGCPIDHGQNVPTEDIDKDEEEAATDINENNIAVITQPSDHASISGDKTLRSSVPTEESEGDVSDFTWRHDKQALRSFKSCGCWNCICCVSSLDVDICAAPIAMNPDTGEMDQRWVDDFFEFKVTKILLDKFGRWIIFSILLGISIWLATHAVDLKKPTSSYRRMLFEEHALEIYESTVRDQYDIGDGNSFRWPYDIYFGVKPIDSGDVFDPAKRGTLEFSEDFDASSAKSQQYLLDLCGELEAWDLTPQTSLNLDVNPCIMFWFKSHMEQSCAQTGSSGTGVDMVRLPQRTTCCDKTNSDFPYSALIFDTCIGDFANYWTEMGVYHGLWFEPTTGKLKMINMFGATIEKYSQSYTEANNFYGNIKTFFNAIDSTPGLPDGFMTSSIGFYALQMAITDGAITSAAYSTIFALLILALLTRRPLSSIFSAFQIMCVVASVIGVFVLLGWELNIIEAIIMSVSVGVACDFSVHLAHSFNESLAANEDETPYTFPRTIDDYKAHYTLSTQKATNAIRELGLTLSMGFLTTFCSGLVLLMNKLYFFKQFGIFMCTLMAFSMFLAFGLLVPFLATFGWVDRLLADWFHRNITQPLRLKFSKLD